MSVNNNNSIDRNMYFTAERKDKAIQKVLKMAKRCAVNCQVDYDKNVRADDPQDSSSVYLPWDRWADMGSDESSYRVYTYKVLASHIKDSIVCNLRLSRRQAGAAEDPAVLPVQTLKDIVQRFGSVYRMSTLSYAIQWHLRDRVNCMDVYAVLGGWRDTQGSGLLRRNKLSELLGRGGGERGSLPRDSHIQV